MIFVMAFDAVYASMGEAVINALNHYHDRPNIVVFTDDVHAPPLHRLGLLHDNVDILPFKPKEYHCGEWHPLIWAKLEAFRLPVDECVMFLDADMIIYNNLSHFEGMLLSSGKTIGASRDFAPFVKQFNSGFDFRQFFFRHYFAEDQCLAAPAFNAGALVFKPDPAVYRELIALSAHNHNVTFYPEQAILNLFCRIHDGWLELPDLSVMPFSGRITDTVKTYGMIHFFTPRPEFMAVPVVRQGEPTLDDMMAWFQETHKTPYPIRRIESDYRTRLNNTFHCADDGGR